MVNQQRPGVISREIAETYGRSIAIVTKEWMQASDWPAEIGRRGRFKEFDPTDVEAWVTRNRQRDTHAPIHTGDPERLLTVKEIAEESGLSERTIRADFSRDRLGPKEGDDQKHGVKMWKRGSIARQLAGRRSRRAPKK